MRIRAHLRFLANLSLSLNRSKDDKKDDDGGINRGDDMDEMKVQNEPRKSTVDEADRCPICYNVFGRESETAGLALLVCAHSLCIDCYREGKN